MAKHFPIPWPQAGLAIYVLLIAFPAGSMLGRAASDDSLLSLLGRGCGLIGCSMLILLVPLGLRLRFLDRIYGLDAILRFHRQTAVAAVALLLLHPVFLALDAGSAGWLGWDAAWPIRLGQLGLAAAILAAASAGACRLMGLDYRWWRLMHKGAYFAPLLGIVHAWRSGTSFAGAPEIRAHAILLVALAAGCALWHYLIFPRLGQKRFRIAAVRREAVDVTRIALLAEAGARFSHLPGQFAFFSLRAPGFPAEEHPFTIASAPTPDGGIEIAAKALGDYTKRLPEVQAGWQAVVDGPYGRFSYLVDNPAALLFIAGGVGITPIMSMLRYWRAQGDNRPAMLIYGNRRIETILFRDELATMRPPLQVVHVLE
ncbi:MAG: ferric reductase-like transmembrane domain-containing protein, partial [Planctomycetota bacterium]|nr:ferric reductase-like transmembrane domain-containing protein [Planctomycetota bacterium]